MLRYAIAIAGAVALISTAAFAEVGDMGTTKVITKGSPDGMAQKKVIIHRNDNAWGPSKKVVIKRHDAGYGGVSGASIFEEALVLVRLIRDEQQGLVSRSLERELARLPRFGDRKSQFHQLRGFRRDIRPHQLWAKREYPIHGHTYGRLGRNLT